MAQVYDADLQTTIKVGKVYPTQAAAPTSANDHTQGYHVGDVWIVPTGPTIYMCAVDTAGAAQWVEL